MIRDKDEIIHLLENGWSRRQICAKWQVRYGTLKSYLIKWGKAHLKNNPKQGNFKPKFEKKSATEYMHIADRNKPAPSIRRYKEKLWEENIKPQACEKCGFDEIAPNGRCIIELHHVNGNRWDNRLDNIQMLCPNCHAMTDNFAGANHTDSSP